MQTNLTLTVNRHQAKRIAEYLRGKQLISLMIVQGTALIKKLLKLQDLKQPKKLINFLFKLTK